MTKEEIIKEIKTHLDETYNIGFHEDAWKIILEALEQEPIILKVNEKQLEELIHDNLLCVAMAEPKTDGNAISRKAVIERIKREEKILYTPTGMNYLIRAIEELPSVTPQEPKTDGDCISREKTLEKFCDYVGSGMSMDDFDALYDIVSKMPSVQPMTGHWINNVNGTYTCDHCGCKHSRSNYCPNCGRRMSEE